MNRIRAAVLGASDGIVSVAALLFAVIAADPSVLLLTALAATIAGACSMGLGEYVSVRAQVDAEIEAASPITVSPIHAAVASAGSFIAGAVLPSAVLLATPAAIRLPVAVVTVLAALGLSGFVSSRLADAPAFRPIVRVMTGGALALAITYLTGKFI